MSPDQPRDDRPKKTWEVIKDVREQSRATGMAGWLVLILATYPTDEHGYCYPGVQRLMRNMKVSRRTVQRLLRELERLGELETVIVPGHTTRYRVCVSQKGCVIAVTPPGGRHPGYGGASSRALGGVIQGTKGRHSCDAQEDREDLERKERDPASADASALSGSSLPSRQEEIAQVNVNNHLQVAGRRQGSGRGAGPTDPRVAPILDYFSQRFQAIFGRPYPRADKRDGAIIKGLPQDLDTAFLKRCIDAFLADREDAFLAKAGWSIPIFKQKLPALIPRVNGYRQEETWVERNRRELREAGLE